MNGSSEQQWYYPNYAADPTTAGGYGTDAAAMTTTGPDQNHGAVAVAPSETTTNGNTEEFARIVGSVAAQLERTRNHGTELEAWTSFASSQLAHHHHHHTVGVVNTTDLPASITDAWQAMAKAATKPVFDDDENVAMARNVRDEKTTAAAVMTSLGDAAESSHHMTVVTMPAGQQSIAVRNLVLTNSLKRMAVMAGEVMQQQQQQQQQETNEISSALLPQLTMVVAAAATTTQNSNATAAATLADPWLQLLGQRLQELQKYHAQHDHHHDHHPETATTRYISSTMGAVVPIASSTVGATTAPPPLNSRYSNSTAIIGYDMATTIQEWTSSLDVALSTEEVMGRYLDLHPHYEYFLQHLSHLRSTTGHGRLTNTISTSVSSSKSASASSVAATRHNDTNEKNKNPNGKRPFESSSSYQYIDFLEDLSKGIGRIWSEEQKLLKRKKYVKCLTELQRYLESFLQRTVPLINIAAVIESVTEAFRATWSRTGGATGWPDKMGEAILATTIGTTKVDAVVAPHPETEAAATTMATTNEVSTIDLHQYESALDLAAKVDGETLKAELSRLGLKCGGTVQDRATRLYLLKHSKLQDLPPKLFVKKPTANTATNATAPVDRHQPPDVAGGIPEDTLLHAKNERRIDIAYREAIVTALLDQLGPTLEATIRRAERRQTQTLKERAREMDEELYGTGMVAVKDHQEDGADNDSDDEDAPIYNPKNVPLDFDGKPIPYWLFKLHGLNHYYPCEICGGESYRGRRNFELHFGEQKHTAGMRSLGIPNTKHFHGVTKIEDAQVLWHSLQEQLQHNKFDERNDEEYEDSHGNVLSRSVYEDLARQNLL